MEFNNYFFIKIRKSGGTTLMNLLNDNNLKKNIKQPKPFILAKKKEYNSVINNYRIPLGKYQGKRCLFAKEILFPNEWDNIFSFALSREPVSRCISMFSYLWRNKSLYYFYKTDRLNLNVNNLKLLLSSKAKLSFSFDVFLDIIEENQELDNIYRPSIHFTTHTSDVYSDITDENGNVIIKKMYKLENMHKALSDLNKYFKLNIEFKKKFLNKGKHVYLPNREQIKKIEKLFSNDFEIYEKAE